MWKNSKKIDVAVIQMSSTADKARNIARALSMTEEALCKKTNLVVLPECFWFRGNKNLSELKKDIAESGDGETVRRFSRLARMFKAVIVLGSIHEKINAEKYLYNTSIVLGPTGKRVGKYRKRNLFCATINENRIRESNVFSPGTRGAAVACGRFCLGLAICYDLRFPGIFCQYRNRGCDVMIVPSNFTHETGKDHWEVLLRSRAIENQCYVLAPNQCGVDDKGIRAYGNSMIVDPWGRVVVRASATKEEILLATIDKRVILEVRKKISPEF